jgi:uncharacterized membrane protein YbhN (UPF0104 family)
MAKIIVLRLKNKAVELMRSKLFYRLVTVFFIIATVGILGYLLYQQKDFLLSYQWHFNWLYILVGFGIYTVELMAVSGVWVWIVSSLDFKLPFFKHLQYFCIAALARRLPGTVWYVAYRAEVYRRENLPAKTTVLASGIEVAVALVSSCLVSLVFAGRTLLQYPFGIWATIAFLAILIVLLQPRLLNWIIKRVSGSLPTISYKLLLSWIIVYCILWVFTGAIIFTIINLFYPLSIDMIGYVIGYSAVVTVIGYLLLFSPTNFGIGEISLSLLLTTVMPSGLAVLSAVGYRIVVIFFEIIWALLAQLIAAASRRN